MEVPQQGQGESSSSFETRSHMHTRHPWQCSHGGLAWGMEARARQMRRDKPRQSARLLLFCAWPIPPAFLHRTPAFLLHGQRTKVLSLTIVKLGEAILLGWMRLPWCFAGTITRTWVLVSLESYFNLPVRHPPSHTPQQQNVNVPLVQSVYAYLWNTLLCFRANDASFQSS